MESIDDGHRELIQMLEDQRLFIEQVRVRVKSLHSLTFFFTLSALNRILTIAIIKTQYMWS